MTEPLLTVTFPQPARLMSLNDRMHWRTRHRLTKTWRKAAWAAALMAALDARPLGGRTRLPEALVLVSLPVPDRRRRDPHNYHLTYKAIVDGLVDAGFWPDDTPEWVSTGEPSLVVDRRARTVTVTIFAREALP